MTVRIPKSLLPFVIGTAIGTAIVALAIAAFSLGRSSDDTGSAGDGADAAILSAKCAKGEAEKATMASGFDDSILAHGAVRADLAESGYPATEPPFFTNNPSDYQVSLLRCRDLNGDGAAEMIVGLAAGASGHMASWAIFTPDSDRGWELAFDREGVPVSSIEVEGQLVIANTPTFGRGDPLCCPSGYKATRVAFDGGEFRLVPEPSAREREVLVSDGLVVALGELDPLVDSPVQAFEAFGTPTEIVGGDDEACELVWGDLGLSIHFANFGGGEACGREGRVATFELVGASAEQAGWRIGRGVRIGDSVDTIRNAYFGTRENGSEFVLVESPSAIGSGGTIPVVSGYAVGDEILAYRFYVGAAGE